MSEEDFDLDPKEEEQTPEYSPAELKALEDGWRPLSEWEGNEEDWVSAKEFNFRGELMSRISSQSGQLNDYKKKADELSEAIKILGEHHKKTAEIERKRILDGLKKEKALALEENDTEAVVEIDDQIADIKADMKADAEATEDKGGDAPNQTPPEVTAWLANPSNSWYHNDPVLKGVANTVSEDYMRRHPEASIMDMLNYTDTKVREEMPHKFPDTEDEVRKPKPKVTEKSTTPRTQKKSKFTIRDLTPEQQSVVKTFVDTGVYANAQEYVDELIANGQLG